MRKISKEAEPVDLLNWKKAHPNSDYSMFIGSLILSIRRACIEEQKGFCAYCCRKITTDDSHNDHVIPQSVDRGLSAEYSNIVASCNDKNTCGIRRQNRSLPITPFDDACETEIQYKYSGKMFGTTDRAETTINVLNLNVQKLKEARKVAIEALQFDSGVKTVEASSLGMDLLVLLEEEINTSWRESQFYPVIISFLRHEKLRCSGGS